MRIAVLALFLAASFLLHGRGDATAASNPIAWDSCFDPVSMDGTALVELRPASGQPALTLAYTAPATDLPVDERQATDWNQNQPVMLSVGEIVLPAGSNAVLYRAKALPVAIQGPARFALQDGHPQPVKRDPYPGDAEPKRIPANSKGTVEVRSGVGAAMVRLVGTIRGKPVVGTGGDTFVPDLVPSTDGPVLRGRLSQPGVVFDAARMSALIACMRPAGKETPIRIPFVTVKAVDTGLARFELRLPDDAADDSGGEWTQSADIMVADGNAGFAALGRLTTVRTDLAFWGAIGTTVGLFAFFAGLMILVAKPGKPWPKYFFMGLFVSRDGDASLSLFQVFLWTILTVWALVYVFLRTFDPLSLTPQVMALLGFAGSASVAARWISASRAPAEATVPAKRDAAPQFWAMLMTDGRPDLLKIQLLAFTLLVITYVAWQVYTNTAFPVLDDNLMLLMGVSNLMYVGGKLAEPTPFQKAEAAKQASDAAAAAVAALERKLKDAQDEKQRKSAEANAATATQAEKDVITARIAVLDADIARLNGADGKSGELGEARQRQAAAEKSYQAALAGLTGA